LHCCGPCPRQLRMASIFSPIPLLRAAKVFGAANVLGWGISCATGSHLHLDLIGTGAFVAAAVTAFPLQTVAFGRAQQLSALIIGAWGTRLAAFLFYRALHTGHDGRLDQTLSTLSGTTGFWCASFIWGCVCFLPHALAAGLSQQPFGPLAATGAVLAIAGVGVEALADFEKWSFKSDPANQGKFCAEGLWGLTQHPNYCGNLLLWTGIVVLNAPRLFHGPSWVLPVACISPLFMYLLFNAQATGQMTNTLELSFEKYGKDPDFLDYAAKVPVIFPWGFAPGAR